MAIVAIVVALGLTALVAQQFELSVFVINMLTGMGLALGIDYSLFVVSRYREERGKRRGELAAIETRARPPAVQCSSAAASSSSPCSGCFVPNSIMRSLATGAILVGIVSVVAALTLLPALLGLLGDKVDALRIPIVGRRSVEASNPEGRFWGAIVRRVLSRPVLSLALSAGVLVALAAPCSDGCRHERRLGPPRSLRLQAGLPRAPARLPGTTTSPAEVVVQNASGAGVSRTQALRTRLAADPRFGEGEIERAADRDVVLSPSPSRATPRRRRLRRLSGSSARRSSPRRSTGRRRRARRRDELGEHRLLRLGDRPAPWVIAPVLLLTFVLLTVVFRSVVVAGTAVLLNLLSVGAAYGLLVLVFQEGIGADLLGFQQADTIEAWVPLFLFSVLFGLSMDYQVFLLSRIRERFDQSRDTTDAVTFGVGSTARIITGAALIIVAVFSGFARGDLIMFQQMGFGVAGALIDATIIRSVLLPSAMKLLGDANWYLPQWLGVAAAPQGRRIEFDRSAHAALESSRG